MAEQVKPGNKTNAQNAPKVEEKVKLTPEQAKTKKIALFKELAPKRVRQVIKSLEILGNCSNRAGYEYTPENVEKIFTTLEKKLAETKAMFSAKAKDVISTFTLD